MSRLIGTKRQAAQTECWPILKGYLQPPLPPSHALLRNPCDPTASRPSYLWPEVSRLCKRAGAKLIFDEIPSGLGKTGRFFAHEHYDVRPDVVVLGKALGGGILPIAAVIAHKHMAVAPELTLGHYTHEKNPVTSRAALTTIEIIEDERLIEQAEQLGQYTANYLRDSLKKQPCPATRGPWIGVNAGPNLTAGQVASRYVVRRSG